MTDGKLHYQVMDDDDQVELLDRGYQRSFTKFQSNRDPITGQIASQLRASNGSPRERFFNDDVTREFDQIVR